MEDHLLPKITLFRDLSTDHGKMSPEESYRDCLKKSLTACHDAWRHSIFKAVNKFEEDRRDTQDEAKGKLELSLTSHQMLPSPANTARGPVSVMSLPAVDVDRHLSLCLCSHAIVCSWSTGNSCSSKSGGKCSRRGNIGISGCSKMTTVFHLVF